jgi:hypothetical protein
MVWLILRRVRGGIRPCGVGGSLTLQESDLMPHKLTRRLAVLCLSAASIFATAGVHAAPPAVLDMAPANPAALLIVPNMRDASDKIANANQLVGSNMPQLDDLASQFRQSLGVLRGLRDDGAFMLVLTDASTLSGNKDKDADTRPAIVLVLPVDDYATFLSNFKGEAVEGVTAIQLPRGRPGYARLVNGYALVSPRRELLTAYTAANAAADLAKTAGLLGAKALERNDLTLIIDSQAMKPVIGPMLQSTLMDDRRAGARPPAGQAMINTLIGSMLDQSRMVTVGMKFDDVAIEMEVTAQFEPDSETGKKLTAGNVKPTLLSAVPDRPYVMTYWADLSNKFALDLLQGIMSKPLANAGGAASEAVVFDANTKAVAGAAFAPRDLAFQQSLLNLFAVVESDQPRAFTTNVKNYITAANGQSMVYQYPRGTSGLAENIRLSTRYSDNAMHLGGVSIDQFKVDYDIPPSVINAIGSMGPILSPIIGSSQTGYIGSTGKFTVVTSRPDSQLVNEGFATANNETGVGTSRSVQSIGARLPERSVMQWYISAAGLVQMYNTMGTIHRMPALAAPQTTEPIAVGIGSDAAGMTTRLVLPLSVLRYMQETADERIRANQPEQPMAQQNQGPQRPPRATAQQQQPQSNARGAQGVRDGVPGVVAPAERGPGRDDRDFGAPR